MLTAENHLIDLLPRNERLRLLGICEPIQLQLSEVLCEPGTKTRHVYFPTDGCISLITPLEGHPGLEVGMIGREGMVGVQVALGRGISPLRALVQASGGSWRIDANAFRVELGRRAEACAGSLPLRADGAAGDVRGMPAVSSDQAPRGTLAPDEPGSRSL